MLRKSVRRERRRRRFFAVGARAERFSKRVSLTPEFRITIFSIRRLRDRASQRRAIASRRDTRYDSRGPRAARDFRDRGGGDFAVQYDFRRSLRAVRPAARRRIVVACGRKLRVGAAGRGTAGGLKYPSRARARKGRARLRSEYRFYGKLLAVRARKGGRARACPPVNYTTVRSIPLFINRTRHISRPRTAALFAT